MCVREASVRRKYGFEIEMEAKRGNDGTYTCEQMQSPIDYRRCNSPCHRNFPFRVLIFGCCVGSD